LKPSGTILRARHIDKATAAVWLWPEESNVKDQSHRTKINVVVLGATGGIGSAIVQTLAGQGYHVVACGRSREKLHALAQLAPADRIKPCTLDVDQVDAGDELRAVAGTIDIVVNAAGVVHPEPFLEADPGHWEAMFTTNVIGPMRIIQAVARDMAARRTGTLAFIGSGQSRAVAANTVAYAATKHAVAAFVAGLRLELGPLGIRIIDLSPGYTGDTGFHRHAQHPALHGAFSERPYEPLRPVDIAVALAMLMALPETVDVPCFELRPRGQFYQG
jgi:NADP-dependent 3-hydroxy acid dehydrogenase YdfG